MKEIIEAPEYTSGLGISDEKSDVIFIDTVVVQRQHKPSEYRHAHHKVQPPTFESISSSNIDQDQDETHYAQDKVENSDGKYDVVLACHLRGYIWMIFFRIVILQ